MNVIDSKQNIYPYFPQNIVNTLMKEGGVPQKLAEEISHAVGNTLQYAGIDVVPTALIREIANTHLISRGYRNYQKKLTRIGIPLHDALEIDLGTRGNGDNANLQANAETSHKRKADLLSKEEALLLLDEDLTFLHNNSDIHIHDLEYFTNRQFCISGDTVIPIRSKNLVSTTTPESFKFEGSDGILSNEEIFTPSGWKPITKITRKPIYDEKLLHITTKYGKNIIITKDHKTPINNNGNPEYIKAENLKIGDNLYPLPLNHPFHTTNPPEIYIIPQLLDNTPPNQLQNIFVKGLKPLFKQLKNEGQIKKYIHIFNKMGIEKNYSWIDRGTLPILVFRKFCKTFNISENDPNVTISTTGSPYVCKNHLPLTEPLMKLIGLFVSDGHYNNKPYGYNIVITKPTQTKNIIEYINETFDTYITISKSKPRNSLLNEKTIMSDSAPQIYFGGKLIYLIFKHILKISDGSSTKNIPQIVYNVPTPLCKAFLSGLFSGDGSAYFNKETSNCLINYSTISDRLCQDLTMLLTSYGIRTHIHDTHEGKNPCHRITITGYDNVSKFTKICQFDNDRQPIIDAYLKTCHGIKRNHDLCNITKIEEISSKTEYVYDISLNGDHADENHVYYANGLLTHNCHDWDLRYFFYYGLIPDGTGITSSVAGPAKRAEVAILHAVKILAAAQTNFAGGQGFYNFLTFFAPYVEGMPYHEIEHLMQMFVYEMTQMMVARGGQTVFSSVQLSPGVPKIWRDKPIVFKGKVWNGIQAPPRNYGNFEREVRLLFLALMNVMIGGDYRGSSFNFPKPEISIEPCFVDEDDWVQKFNKARPDVPTYKELYLKSFELASKFGTPYFDNQIPVYRGAGDGISCYQCQVGSDMIQLPEFTTTLQDLFVNLATDHPIKTQDDESEIILANIPIYSISKECKREIVQAQGILRKKYKGEIITIQSKNPGHKTLLVATPDHKCVVKTEKGYKFIQARNIQLTDELCYFTPTGQFKGYPIGTIISDPHYNGYVYSIIEAGDSHIYLSNYGVCSGNCCAYTFASVAADDPKFNDKLQFKDGAHFTMGSKQVITLNCPRLAYKSKDAEEFLTNATELIDSCMRIFKFKDSLMKQIIQNKRMPFVTQRPPDPNTGAPGDIASHTDDLVWTIGILGINEVVEHFTGESIEATEQSTKLAMYLVLRLRQIIQKAGKENNIKTAFARTPAETTCQRFAVADLRSPVYSDKAKPRIKGDLNTALIHLTTKSDLPIYYTNGTHTPMNKDIPITERIACEEKFFPLVDGGNIFHVWLAEGVPNPQGLMDISMNLCKNTNIGYFAYTRDLTIPAHRYRR